MAANTLIGTVVKVESIRQNAEMTQASRNTANTPGNMTGEHHDEVGGQADGDVAQERRLAAELEGRQQRRQGDHHKAEEEDHVEDLLARGVLDDVDGYGDDVPQDEVSLTVSSADSLPSNTERPALTMLTLSQMFSTSESWWLERKMVLPSSLSWSRMSRTSFCPTGSSPLDGSSRTTSSGSLRRACAMPKRCSMPLEYLSRVRCESWGRPTISMRSADFSWSIPSSMPKNCPYSASPFSAVRNP